MSGNSPTPSLFCAIGSEETVLSDADIKKQLRCFLEMLGPREDVLILPPDYTRFHSQAGKITRFISEYYNFINEPHNNSCDDNIPSSSCTVDVSREEVMDSCGKTRSSSSPNITILPALGTHFPMTKNQIKKMFGDALAEKTTPNSPFVVHDWRNNVETIGHVPAEMINEATYGLVDRPWPVQLNKIVWNKRLHDPSKQNHKSLVLSVGQVVPHEVMGMANFNKNLFIGVGGVEAINLSHFIGAVYGMERMMGRASNPLRSILNYASEQFLKRELDLWYILTVMGTNKETDKVEMRGLYIGNDIECYTRACDLSLMVNFTMLNRAPKKIVVYLNGDEFHSTWLGNKAIYRTRMAIADGGELVILAPGVKQFGEDNQIDQLIRTYGYIGTPGIMKAMEEHEELKENLSAVAHLIHGSSEDRFKVTYCPGHLSRDEVESVGFQYADLESMMKRYNPDTLRDGWNRISGDNGGKEEEFYFISNPALGLWAVQSRFEDENRDECIENVDLEQKPISLTTEQVASDNSGGVGGWAKGS